MSCLREYYQNGKIRTRAIKMVLRKQNKTLVFLSEDPRESNPVCYLKSKRQTTRTASTPTSLPLPQILLPPRSISSSLIERLFFPE